LREPIYLVAGHRRSFTNAAVDCIWKGSGGKLRPLCDDVREEEYATRFDDDGYKFNDGRLFEMGRCPDCQHATWAAMNRGGYRMEALLPDCGSEGCWTTFRHHPEIAAGRLMKTHITIPYWWLPEWDYRLLVLMRDYEEIRQSWAAIGDELDKRPEQYYAAVGGFYAVAPVEKKILVWAQDAFGTSSLKNLNTWKRIRDEGDFPIDPKVAAGVVKPKLNRYRRGETITDRMPGGIRCTYTYEDAMRDDFGIGK